MRLPTFDEFMATEGLPNSWVREPGFEKLYVRKSRWHLEDRVVQTVDVANVAAKRPGAGAFKRFVEKLRARYPQYGVFVENVLDARFGDGLRRLGFKMRPGHPPPCFYLLSVYQTTTSVITL